VTINGDVRLEGGAFGGAHTVRGNVHADAATIAPGSSVGTLSITGDVSLSQDSLLDFELGPPNVAGSGANDLIDITGALTLDGTLNITGLTGFGAGTYRLFDYGGALTDHVLAVGAAPNPGWGFRVDPATPGQVNLVVTALDIPGDVDHNHLLNSLDIDTIFAHAQYAYGTQYTRGDATGLDYDVQYDVNGDQTVDAADVLFELGLVSSGPGDANLDRYTELLDFQVMLDQWTDTGLTWATGDFTGDGQCELLDFQVLLDYWTPGGWGTSQAPEPATFLMLALGALGLLRRRRA
jgi:hypothetical protein